MYVAKAVLHAGPTVAPIMGSNDLPMAIVVIML